jgi:hypothetical protein
MPEQKSEPKINQSKVAAVVEYVRANPGCTKRSASAAVAKHASYGYRFVQAALTQGLIAAERAPGVRGQPYALRTVDQA